MSSRGAALHFSGSRALAPHLAASWGDKEEEAATIEELGGFLLWLGIANADVRKGHGGIGAVCGEVEDGKC